MKPTRLPTEGKQASGGSWAGLGGGGVSARQLRGRAACMDPGPGLLAGFPGAEGEPGQDLTEKVQALRGAQGLPPAISLGSPKLSSGSHWARCRPRPWVRRPLQVRTPKAAQLEKFTASLVQAHASDPEGQTRPPKKPKPTAQQPSRHTRGSLAAGGPPWPCTGLTRRQTREPSAGDQPGFNSRRGSILLATEQSL